MTPVALVLSRLEGVRSSGAGHVARCPAHDDHEPSLKIDEGDDQRILLKCHAGCAPEAILAALGLTWSDCFAEAPGPRPSRGPKPEAPLPPVEVLGRPTPRQIAVLTKFRRIRCAEDLAALGGQWVRVWGQEWCAFRTLAEGWKLWAVDGNGKPRLDDGGKLIRRNLGPVSLILAPALRQSDGAPARVYDVEGESDLLALVSCAPEVAAITSTGGAGTLAGHKRHADTLRELVGAEVVVVRDLDEAGRQGAEKAAAFWAQLGVTVRVLTLPADLGEKGDLRDYLLGKPARNGTAAVEPAGTMADLEKLVDATPVWRADTSENRTVGDAEQPRGPWAHAVTAAALLNEADATVDWIADAVAAPGSITGIASPRGLGKTHVIHALAVAVATGGTFRGRSVRPGRVLIIDRDNSRREIRRRLRQWCGEEPPATLEILTRDEAPALTDSRAWESFPFGRYALVILDSLGASTEGVSENDGGASGKALAPLLDLARRGPAAVVLLNVPKAASNYRGSGVIADRFDILYEVRDATDLVPSPSDETWWSRLPEAGEAAWADRARRRGRRDDYRLVLVATKYRIGEEPDPIALEVMLAPGAWAVRDVTDLLEAAHDAARGQTGTAAETARRQALDALAEEVRISAEKGSPIHRSKAEERLGKALPDVRRQVWRTLVESGGEGRWQLVETKGRGRHPQVLLPVGWEGFSDSAAKFTATAKPCGATPSASPNMADLAAEGRPYSLPRNVATGKGSADPGIWPPKGESAPPDEGEEARWEG